MERLAALEAEVKADGDAQRARKAAAVAKLRDQRVMQTSERDQLRARQAELVGKRRPPAASPDEGAAADEGAERNERDDHRDRSAHDAGHLQELGGALELASKANRVKQELARTPQKGEKSWIKSGVLSFTGPIGWLYAGSFREAIPATVGWVALLALASKFLPLVLMMPVFMVVLPLSAIAGVVYALQYNRNGGRQRLFDKDKSDKDKSGKAPQKQLRRGS
jgi:hypothetical protein